jgi:two-component system sensor histidine kinase AtoS
MDVSIIAVLAAGLISSLLLIVLFSRRLSANIDIITDGLSTLAQKTTPACLNCPANWANQPQRQCAGTNATGNQNP